MADHGSAVVTERVGAVVEVLPLLGVAVEGGVDGGAESAAASRGVDVVAKAVGDLVVVELALVGVVAACGGGCGVPGDGRGAPEPTDLVVVG